MSQETPPRSPCACCCDSILEFRALSEWNVVSALRHCCQHQSFNSSSCIHAHTHECTERKVGGPSGRHCGVTFDERGPHSTASRHPFGTPSHFSRFLPEMQPPMPSIPSTAHEFSLCFKCARVPNLNFNSRTTSINKSGRMLSTRCTRIHTNIYTCT